MWAVGCLLLEMMMGKALWDFPHDFGTKSLEDPNFMREFISAEE